MPWLDSRPSASALRFRLSVALRSRPQFSLATAPAGFALRLNFRSELAPLASAQPSCRLPAPALDVELAPSVSCHSFRPAFWPASLQRNSSRPCAFVLKRPSGMPLTLRCFGLSPSAPSGPRAGFQSSRPSSSPPAIGLWLVPPQTAPALRPSPLAAANSQRPVDHRALDPRKTCVPLNPPSRLLPPAFGLRLAPLWNRPLSPASASPLSLKSGLRLASTCRVFRSGCCPCEPHPSGAVRDRS